MSNTPPPDPLSLMQRDGLPDPLRALIKAFPRAHYKDCQISLFWDDWTLNRRFCGRCISTIF